MASYDDVVLLLTAEAHKELTRKLYQSSIEILQFFHEERDYHKTNPETGSCIYYWEANKWSIEAVEFLDSFTESLTYDQFRYIRLGDEYYGVIESGLLEDNTFDVRVCTGINFDKLTENMEVWHA